MSMPDAIHILGASGAGTTTLGRAICGQFGHKLLDTDDYFWMPTDPPYTTTRSREEKRRLLQQDAEQAERFVISGSLCGRGDGWGDIVIPMLDCAVFLDTPTLERIARLQRREQARFGARILPGGDMYEEHTHFIAWAKTYDTGGLDQRSRAMHMQWMSQLDCPVLTLDGTRPVDELIAHIAASL